MYEDFNKFMCVNIEVVVLLFNFVAMYKLSKYADIRISKQILNPVTTVTI